MQGYQLYVNYDTSMTQPAGWRLGAILSVQMLAVRLLSRRERERGDEKQMMQFRSAHKKSQESSEKVREMLYAQIQDSTEKEYALEKKTHKQTKNCSKIKPCLSSIGLASCIFIGVTSQNHKPFGGKIVFFQLPKTRTTTSYLKFSG